VARRVLAGSILFLLCLTSLLLARTLVTIESEKARLTLALLSRLVRLEKNYREHLPVKILVLTPRSKTAFQDQNIVNEAVRDFFRKNREFEAFFVQTPDEALKLLSEENFDIFYIAGPVPKLKEILKSATAKKILTISHLPEFLELGLAMSLDLNRRKASIVVNQKVWQKLNLNFPPEVTEKFCFIAPER